MGVGSADWVAGRKQGHKEALAVAESVRELDWATHPDVQRQSCTSLVKRLIVERLRRLSGVPGKTGR